MYTIITIRSPKKNSIGNYFGSILRLGFLFAAVALSDRRSGFRG